MANGCVCADCLWKEAVTESFCPGFNGPALTAVVQTDEKAGWVLSLMKLVALLRQRDR